MKNLFRALIRSNSDGLFGRAMSAGFWAAGLRVFLRLAVIVRTVILARLLSPDDFGLMAIAVLSITLLERFTQSGVESALVQRSDAIEPYLNSAWTLKIVRGLAMAGMLLVAAPWIAAFFDAPDATPVIRALSVTLVFAGFVNIATVTFVKDLRFDKFFLFQVAGSGLDVIVSISAAFALRNVWALVIGSIAGAIGRLVASYIIDPYRPRFRWIWAQVVELFNFGKWVTLSHILAYISLNVDDILVGRLLGVRELGWYRMAYNFSQAVATEITSVTSQVAFPTYSKMQGDITRLRAAFMGTLHLISFLGFPLAVGTALVAEDLAVGILGPKWLPIIVPLQLLSLSGLMRGLAATLGPLLQSQGRPNIPPRFTMVKLAVLAVILVPLINRYGINGAALAVLLGGFVSGLPALVYSLRTVDARGADVWQAIGIPAINTAFMAVVVFGVSTAWFPEPSALGFFLSGIVGIAAYGVAVAVAARTGRYRAPKDLLGYVRRAAG